MLGQSQLSVVLVNGEIYVYHCSVCCIRPSLSYVCCRTKSWVNRLLNCNWATGDLSSEYSIKTENKVEVYFLVDQASGGYDGYNGNYYYHRIMQAGSPQCPSLTNTYGTTYPAIATDCMRVYPIYSNGMPYQPVSQVMYDP